MKQKQLIEYTNTYNMFRECTNNKKTSWEIHLILRDIHILERKLRNLNERAFNYRLTKKEEQRRESYELKVTDIANSLGFDVKFNHDPGIGAIKFLLPNKRYNNWDFETWGIYW